MDDARFRTAVLKSGGFRQIMALVIAGASQKESI